MKVTTKKLGDGKMHFDCVASAEEVNRALHSASVVFAQQMGLQPQPGKTVAEVAEEKMGIKDLDAIVANQAIETLVPYAIDKKNFMPTFPPKAQPKSALRRDAEFSFALDVLLRPDYELTSYDPIAITVPRFKTEGEEELIDQQINLMAENYTEYTVDPDATDVEKGTVCKIAIKATQDGKELSGLSTDGRTYIAGMGYMPEGFDENVIGMKAGESKQFSFTGPDVDKDGNVTEMTVDCDVTILEIQKEAEVVVDDAWVKKYMPLYKDLNDMRESIRRSLNHQAKEQYEGYVRQVAASELAKRFQGKIADEVYENMRNNILNNIQANLQQQGKTYEEFVQENGGQEQFGMMLMVQTRDMLVQGYALDALFRHERMKLAEEDLLEACHAMNPQVNPRQMMKELQDSGRSFALRETAERLKANKWLVEHAEITYRD